MARLCEQMWFILIVAVFTYQTQVQSFKSFPSSENLDFRSDRPNSKFLEGANYVEDYPFYLRYFNNENFKDGEMKKSPFVSLKEIRSRAQLTCSCEVSGIQTIKLGSNYVPRILRTASCKPERCLTGFCRPIEFKVPVLRKKKDDEDVESASLPLELSDDYVRETRTIVVGCQCKL